jgi:ubiquinol-cytochrome c reductase cytochrome c subunit
VCGALALIAFAGQGQGAPGRAAAGTRAAAGGTTTGATGAGAGAAGVEGSSSQLAYGRRLFLSSCASCHGFSAEGIRGRGPSLRGVGALAADFYLRTGRMPLPSPRAQPLRTQPAFPEPEVRALVAYVGSLGGPPIPRVNPKAGSVSDGEDLFALSCAGCHTIQAQGGIVTGAVAPSLMQATPTQIAEAIRIGPYVMPRFGSGELSDGQIDSIARFVQSTKHPTNRGGWGIGRIGPIPEGMVAWLLAMSTLVLVIRLIGERAPR